MIEGGHFMVFFNKYPCFGPNPHNRTADFDVDHLFKGVQIQELRNIPYLIGLKRN